MKKEKLKLVYVAGPFRATSPWEVEQNIRRAEHMAFDVWSLGMVGIAPHSLGRFYDKSLPDDLILRGMLDLMLRCDAVVCVTGWSKSAGTQAEIREALAVGIPVYYDLQELQASQRGT